MLKSGIGRERPFGQGHTSFPSSHASAGAAFGTLTARNLDSIEVPPPLRAGLKAGTYTAVAALAWARVETGSHFPSDVLGGIAIANFVTAFIHYSFLGLPLARSGVSVGVVPQAEGGLLSVGLSF